ncbi:Haloalkane dehalogenase [Polaromonas vacuolata]|uniref:tRNA-specific adenosine deaminase n=1 Tax=Polaromonas vacuolata TaxID=37448 RepID=A0A6H2H941_9BURK|nr:tRNA adenosine(34) deaminase TadA [Polaromonas vacuolata]QJC56389.1 Haloalkane dehalogenase [Polaromonas vacuolata]
MSDAFFMQQALSLAAQAALLGEVPVAALVVHKGKIIASASNAPISAHDPTAHAEILALRAAASLMGNYRLDECELYVTLEPCAMCSGAMLHARLKRVVFGAPEPKTGAAGSVLNLFTQPQLNHQTALLGGVLADQSVALMQNFFRQRRSEKRLLALVNHPLREDALRTPDSAFENLPDYPWLPHYISDMPSLAGLRMHYLDEGPKHRDDSALTYLCLHGNPAWSYLYRKMLPTWLAAGQRIVAPDLIGFGKSDKPKKDSHHSFSQQRQSLIELVERLDLTNVVLVVQGWGGMLGLTLPMAAPERYRGLLVMNTYLACGDQPLPAGLLAWRDMCRKNSNFDVAELFARAEPLMSGAERMAYAAAFPDRGHRAALRAFPALVPSSLYSDGATVSRQAREFWREQWTGQVLMAIGEQDPVFGTSVMAQLRQDLRGCDQPMLLPYAGHFVPEDGEPLAHAALKFFQPPRQ